MQFPWIRSSTRQSVVCIEEMDDSSEQLWPTSPWSVDVDDFWSHCEWSELSSVWHEDSVTVNIKLKRSLIKTRSSSVDSALLWHDGMDTINGRGAWRLGRHDVIDTARVGSARCLGSLDGVGKDPDGVRGDRTDTVGSGGCIKSSFDFVSRCWAADQPVRWWFALNSRLFFIVIGAVSFELRCKGAGGEGSAAPRSHDTGTCQFVHGVLKIKYVPRNQINFTIVNEIIILFAYNMSSPTKNDSQKNSKFDFRSQRYVPTYTSYRTYVERNKTVSKIYPPFDSR